jgi:hypothetical protein
MYLEDNVDFRLHPGELPPDNKRKVEEHTASVMQWIETERELGWNRWLAVGVPSGYPRYNWCFKPDSREKYLEANYFDPGAVPEDFGDYNGRGMGWQFPLFAVFSGKPTASDLDPLRRNGIPYTVQGADPEPDVDEPDCPVVICAPISPLVLAELLYILDDATVLSKAWKPSKKRRQLRQDIIQPLRELLEELEDEPT